MEKVIQPKMEWLYSVTLFREDLDEIVLIIELEIYLGRGISDVESDQRSPNSRPANNSLRLEY
jgi:hypothetical protein